MRAVKYFLIVCTMVIVGVLIIAISPFYKIAPWRQNSER